MNYAQPKTARAVVVGIGQLLIAGTLQFSAHVQAQQQPAAGQIARAAKQVPLHALPVAYPNPYRAMGAGEVKVVLDRVYAYLERSTPAELVNQRTGTAIPALDRADPEAVLKRGHYRLDGYEWGVTYAGMLAVGAVTGDSRYTEYTRKRHQLMADLTRVYYPSVQADPENARAPIKRLLASHALDDSGALCMSFLKAQAMGVGVDYRQMIDICGSYVTRKEYRLQDGTLARGGPGKNGQPQMRPLPNSLWLDDMYMGIPTIALMGRHTGQAHYYDDAVRQVVQFSQRMFVPAAGLYMHGYVEGMKDHPELHWARANGWAVMTMVEVLEVLPKDHAGFKVVEDQLRRHIRGLAKYQHKDGLWHQLIDRNDSYLETSAAAIYAYAIARAINRGYVDKEMYGPMANLAWNAVAEQVNAKGEVEGVCVGTGMAFDPAFYYYRPVNVRAAHGYGPVLLAGAEIIDMNRRAGFGLNDSGLMYQGQR